MHKYQDLGRLLARLRVNKGIATQGEFAKVLGFSQQTVSRWEAGSSRPRPDQIPQIAAALQADGQEILAAAGYTPDAVTVSFDRPVPLHALTAESFERFCLDLLQSSFPTAAVHPAGKQGHKQYGIDIDASFPDKTIHTFQCKREMDFGPAKVRKAVNAHTAKSDQKFILLSRVASPQARTEIRKHADWDIWDQEDISRQLRSLPMVERRRIIDIFFPGQRFALLGETSPGPWLTVDDFFAPLLVKGRVFNHAWELVGRAEELESLGLALADRSVIAVSLIGNAGGGKSRVLRSALQAYKSGHPDHLVRVASTTENITLKSLEELGAGKKLLVVDDAHDRDDIELLVRYVADSRNTAKLLLVYRPYWISPIERELGQLGLTGPHIRSITLGIPTKADASRLAVQVLKENGATADAAAVIAELAYDSPLAVVVGAHVVAKDGVHPQLFGSNEQFRSAVLRRYEKVIAEDIATGKDQDKLHAMIRVIALIQPVLPDDPSVLGLLENIEKIDSADATRLAKLLIDSGVLFKRGSKYRLSPDLLADSIIETDFIRVDGLSNGSAERIFAEANPEHKEHLLLNFGRLDWRRNEGDTSRSPLLNDLWQSLTWGDKYRHPDVKAAAEAAYFQPRQALAFARRLADDGHGLEEDVGRMIGNAAYNFDYILEACALLWEIGKSDGRPTHRHPYHPIRMLTELAAPDPRKPLEHLERVVDFALSLLDEEDSWDGVHSPFEILRGILAADGHYTSAATSRSITTSRYTVNREVIKGLRTRVVDAIVNDLTHSNPKRGYLAAQILSETVRGPMEPANSGKEDPWGTEFLETLTRVESILRTRSLAPTVAVRIAESIHWHAFYGPSLTRSVAEKIMAHLDRDLETKVARALIDGWGMNTWPIDVEGGRKSKHEADITELSRTLGDLYPDPKDLASFLNDRLDEIAAAVGRDSSGSEHLFIGVLLSSNTAFATFLAEASLEGHEPKLGLYGASAFGTLIAAAPQRAQKRASELFAQGDVHLEFLAESYARAQHSQPYTELDIQILTRVFSSKDPAVVRNAGSITREVRRHDANFAVRLLALLDIGIALESARELYVFLAHDHTIPFTAITDEQLQHFVMGLRGVKDVDDYWINAFLKKAIARKPGLIIDLAKGRIDDAIQNDDWKNPLGHAVKGEDALELLSHPDGEKLLLDLLEWARERIDTKRYGYHLGLLVRSLCNSFDNAFVSILEAWSNLGTAQHFEVVSAILREAPQNFVYEQGAFISRLLGRARRLGRKVERNLSSSIFAAAVSGLRSGEPGKPFDFDLRMKALAELELSRISRADPTYDLYTSLLNHANEGIAGQEREGRRMDEEDEAD